MDLPGVSTVHNNLLHVVGVFVDRLDPQPLFLSRIPQSIVDHRLSQGQLVPRPNLPDTLPEHLLIHQALVEILNRRLYPCMVVGRNRIGLDNGHLLHESLHICLGWVFFHIQLDVVFWVVGSTHLLEDPL